MGVEFDPNRRKLLKFGATSIASAALSSVIPQISLAESPEAQKEEEWNPMFVRKDDWLETICAFYSIRHRRISEIIDYNRKYNPDNKLPNPQIIRQGDRIYLPLDKKRLDSPFVRLAFSINGMTSFAQITDQYGNFLYGPEDTCIFFNQQNYPYLFLGHSSPTPENQDSYPFHGFMRELLRRDIDLSTVRIWLSRSLAEKKGCWMECVFNFNEIGYWTPVDEITQLNLYYKLSTNSRKIALATCAVERGIDVIYTYAKVVNYFSNGPPIPLSSG